ncbi:GNAT family N-acetyltransferase [Allonocardiopsis opalescens]|uniref:RimJ/RimL family protein N-acetyltransferase n=1 Tax=Allonocardiopsis opalescens TaxID=1144618 RepID=A0A2T0PVB1_9ACTN|nr:GNAT family protein [Allonocardiopsis opalescens]PRX95447.1 RimJ/RimL family protein N-acetyltransferase [Allonocardiopsis opalescens]
MYPIDLSSARLQLRELVPSDVADLVKVYGDDATVRHLSFTPRTVDQCTVIVDSAVADAAAEPRTVYMLAVAKEGGLVGTGRLGIDDRPHSAQIGFAVRSDLWGQGLGAETVRLLLRLGFDVLGLKRIWGARSPLNEASARVMNGAGMVEEGRIRRHLWTRGAWRDSVVHSILDDEWHRDSAPERQRL